MRAAYYEQNGPANAVLKLGEIETPRPGPGEVRVKLATSGVNPSDVKARSGATRKIAYPRVIPHSDGAGEIDLVGDGVSATRTRRTRVGVERAMAASIRHLRGIHRAPRRASGALAGQNQFRSRRLSRHSGDDGLPRHCGCRCRARRDAFDRRRRRRRRASRRAIRQGRRRDCDCHRQLAGESQYRARGRRRSHHRLPARKRRRAGDGDHRKERRRCHRRGGFCRQRASSRPRCCASAAPS